MLNTDNRKLLLSSLRPPIGYRFDRAVGTTYTLDLLSLMIAPLALALVDFDGINSVLRDPLILMDSLRRVTGRLIVFCQAGGISVPAKQNLLYHYLENSVVEVNKKGGVFHPKIWILRYTSERTPPLYRMLVLSRNLTFDRSWDLMLQLEGEVDETRTRGLASNSSLADFLSELPHLAVNEVMPEIRDQLGFIAKEIRRVRWQTPEPFEGSISFHPIGIPHHRTLTIEDEYQRLMVLSPFLQDRPLLQWAKKGNSHVLISRAESIDSLSEGTLTHYKSAFILQDPTEDTHDDPLDEAAANWQPSASVTDLSGLHAKLVVCENGKNASWYIGSANATENGFWGRNVEFMVKLNGPRKRVGIDTVLGWSGDKTDFPLSALLQTYRRSSIEGEDTSQKKAEKLAEALMSWLVNAKMQLNVHSGETGYELILQVEFPDKPPKGTHQVTCWPISLSESAMLPLDLKLPEATECFPNLSLLALTRFIAFEITTRVEECIYKTRFVLTLPALGMPEGRSERVLSEIISNQAQFLRYLKLLLGQDDYEVSQVLTGINLEEAMTMNHSSWELGDVDILENLLRTISRVPGRINRIAEIVECLSSTPEGKRALPSEFISLWHTVNAWRSDSRLEGK